MIKLRRPKFGIIYSVSESVIHKFIPDGQLQYA